MTTPTAEELRSTAEYYEREVASLTRRYPGARPGWVSCDIGLARQRARECRELLSQMESSA